MNAFYLFTILLAAPSLSVVASTLTRETATPKFDYLLFAQFWPPTSCLYFEEEHAACRIPDTVNGWTIHGLWPSIPGTEAPQYCNKSMTFNYTQIQSLAVQLDSNWPFYKKTGPRTELWEHEWTKHGTCAYSLPQFQGEMKYFNQTLNLHKFQTTSQVLAKSGIVPSDSALYKPMDIFEALKKGYGTIPDITCFFDEKTRTHHLEQVWLCFDKQLNRIDCPEVSIRQKKINTPFFKGMQETENKGNSYFEGCPKEGSVAFKPIPKQ